MRSAAALVLAVAGLTAAAGASAAPVSWTVKQAPGTILGEDGSIASAFSVRSPAGQTRTLPDGWRIVGLRGDGAAFAWKRQPILVKIADGHGGFVYQETQFGIALGSYAWFLPAGTLEPAPISPVTGAFFSADWGVRDDAGVWHSIGGSRTVDGLTVCSDGPCTSAIYTRPWNPVAVSSGGWVVGDAEDWFYGRTFLFRGRPGVFNAALIDHVDVDTAHGGGRNDPRGFPMRGVSRDGDVLANPYLGSVGSFNRQVLYPGVGGAATVESDCTGASVPRGSMADDGSLLVLPCGPAAGPVTTFAVTRGGQTLQRYDGPPLAFLQVLDDGWVAAAASPGTPQQHLVLVVGGRATDLATALGAATPGTGLSVVSMTSHHALLLRAFPPGSPTVRYFTAAQRAVLGVSVSGVDGAPANGVTVTVTDASTKVPGARARTGQATRVRTNARGVASIPATGGAITVAISGGCFAGPTGCTSRLRVPLGLGTPRPVTALAGRNAARATVIGTAATPLALKLSRGKISVGLRCLRNAACTGPAVLTLKGVRGSAGSGRVSLKRQARGSVAVTLTAAAARAIGRTPRAGSVRIVVAGRALVVRLAIRR